jgi:myo-inositol 2-dehydrogenase / D-chiro-inositol 1-dehydrogenase
MNHTLRYGVIGCGSMGREHIDNLFAMGGVEITALADPHGPSVQAALHTCAGALRQPPQVFDDHRALLASGLCDAVVIATPNHTHVTMMRDALAVPALHILVEKPLVTRIEDGVDLIQRAQGRSGIVWVAQEYRYMPPVAELLKRAHGGEVGRIHQVAIREHRAPFYPKVGDWNRFTANTGGTLVEKCCHYFNLMDLVLGEHPVSIYASGDQRVNHLDEVYDGKRSDILDSAYCVLEYPSGARAMLDLCMFAEGSLDNEHLTVVGDTGKLESMLPSGELRHSLRADWGKKQFWGQESGTGRGVSVKRVHDPHIKYFGNHFGASYVEHQRFAAAIRSGTPPEIPLAEGLRAVATGLAAHKSIDEGRVVKMSEVLPAGW